MLGIGGGLVLVPALALMFATQGQIPAAETLHMALGTSMASIILRQWPASARIINTVRYVGMS